MKTVIILFVLFFSFSIVKAQSFFYISPGLGISWDFSKTISLDYKISFGKMREEEEYYNITVGDKKLLTNRSQKTSKEFFYIELQAASFMDYYPLSAGGGIGIAFFNKNKKKEISPKITLFGGIGVFATLNYIYKDNLFEFGIKGVLPVPLDKRYRNLNQ